MNRIAVWLGLLALLGMGGCGGNGGTGDVQVPGREDANLALGTLRVGAVGASLRTLTLGSPSSSPVAFTAIYGAKIVRLQEMGRGKIAFVSWDGSNEIFTMNADGSGQTNVSNNPASEAKPSWSPDGRKIVFDSDRDGNKEIYVMNADGSGITNLSRNSALDAWPAWPPDGGKIAFHSDRDANHEI